MSLLPARYRQIPEMTVLGRGAAGRKAWNGGKDGSSWGSIVAALMPLFLPITPPRSVAAHNDTLNGRPEDTGAA